MSPGVTVLSESPLRLKVVPRRRTPVLNLLGSLALLFGIPLPFLQESPAVAALAFVCCAPLLLPVVYMTLGGLVNHLIFELGDQLRVTEAPLPFLTRGPFARRDVSAIAVRGGRRRRRRWRSIDAQVNGVWRVLGTAWDPAAEEEIVARLNAALGASAPAATPARLPDASAAPAPAVIPVAAAPAVVAAPSAAAGLLTPANEGPHVRALRRMAESGAPPVDALLHAVAPLGTLVRPQVGWMDGNDRVWLGADWPEHDAALRAVFEARPMQASSVPELAAKLGRPARFRLTPSPSNPRVLFPSAVWAKTPPPAEALRWLAATGKVKDSAVVEMARYWPATVTPIELQHEAGLARDWSFLGVVAREALVPTVESLAAAMRLLEAHRAVPYHLASLPGTFAISLSAVFDTVLPMVYVHVAGIDWHRAEQLVVAATGDLARTQRCLAPLRELGGAPTVRLRLSTEGPVRVMVTAPLP